MLNRPIQDVVQVPYVSLLSLFPPPTLSLPLDDNSPPSLYLSPLTSSLYFSIPLSSSLSPSLFNSLYFGMTQNGTVRTCIVLN